MKKEIERSIALLNCEILTFKGSIGEPYKVSDYSSLFYQLQSMEINSIMYNDMELCVGDTIVSYSGSITHQIAKFKIGVHGYMCYYANDDMPKHEMSITNIVSKL